MNAPTFTCALCGRSYVISEGRVVSTNGTIDLCHIGTGRSCYVRWTVYGERPTKATGSAPRHQGERMGA